MLRFISLAIILLLHGSSLAQVRSPHGQLPWSVIVADGKDWSLVELPLRNFKDRNNALNFDVEDFHAPSHMAAWEIRNNALYLTDLKGMVGGKPFNPSTAFGKELPVRADWYSGKLTLVEKPVEIDYALNAVPKFVPAQVYLVSHGRVIYMRSLMRMAIGTLPSDVGFTLKREDDHFVAIPKPSTLKEAIFGVDHSSNRVMSGDIVHSLTDPNGISLELAGENEEVANAALSGVRGTEVTFVVSSPVVPQKTRVVKVQR